MAAKGLDSIPLAVIVVALSACEALLPQPKAHPICDFPPGAPILFVRENVTLADVGLARPEPHGDERGTLFVAAEPIEQPGTSRLRGWCLVSPDEMEARTGAVPDDWTPPD